MDEEIESLKELLDVCEDSDDEASIRLAIVGRRIIQILEVILSSIEVNS